MALRFPLQTIASFTDSNEVGAGSVAGGVAHAFQLPMDIDGVVVKFTASAVGGYSATFQTSDDGGTTYYDVARTSVVSNANGTTAEWLAIPTATIGAGPTSTSVVATGSVQSFQTTIGNAAASTLSQKTFSGLPILGIQNRIFLRLTGNITSAASNSAVTTVYANSQSANHS